MRWNEASHLNCLDDELAAAYVEGRLDATDREVVECHLEQCALCAEDARSLRQFRTEMAAYPRAVFSPASSTPRVTRSSLRPASPRR